MIFRLKKTSIACMVFMMTLTSSVGATFHPGDRGNQILAIQQQLNSMGSTVDADGDYGSQTTEAVRMFQTAHGLDADGIVGSMTYQALMGADIPDNACTHFVQNNMDSDNNSSGSITADNVVMAVQQALVRDGYAVSVDGVLGAETDTAIRQFQGDHGLEVDGIVGGQTFYALTGQTLPTAPFSYGNTQESSAGESIVDAADQYLGVPYVYGGNTPNGFDCSGFTKYVFSSIGITLPRTADEQYDIGTPVAYPNLRPGDLLFFNSGYSGISHTGIYVGNHEFVSATSSQGVVVADLDNAYWSSCYVGARRVV